MSSSDETVHLIEQAVSGQHTATAKLLVLNSARLSMRLRSRLELNPFADFSADDVLQEVFVDVFRGISTFDVEKSGAFLAWLDRVADNRLAKTIRDRSRKKRGGKTWQSQAADSSIAMLINELRDEGAVTGSQEFMKGEAKDAIKLCIAALPDQQREAIELSYLEQKSLDEIADAMAITKDAVRGLHYRAKQAMRSMLGESSRWFR
jgi:RNA polymerase sigma-70 factor (ECF subfamily)